MGAKRSGTFLSQNRHANRVRRYIRPFNLVSALLDPWNFLQNHVQPFLRKFAHILSCYAAFHLNWPCISTLAQIAIMVATSSFVHLTFIGFFVLPLPAGRRVCCWSHFVVERTRGPTQVKVRNPGCIAPGVADRGGVSVWAFSGVVCPRWKIPSR